VITLKVELLGCYSVGSYWDCANRGGTLR